MTKQLTIRMRGADTAEVLLYDTIGRDFWSDGIDAKTFRDQVKAVKAHTMNLRVNSPGGSVTEGAAMLNALDDWRKANPSSRIEVDIDGLAASAATFVMMAGHTIRVASNALVMVHNPMAGVMGGAADMRHTADLLDKVKGQILDAYMRKSSAGREQLSAWMDAETWFTGQEAVDAGLADEVGGAVDVANFAGLTDRLARLGAKRTPKLPEADAASALAEQDRLRRERLSGYLAKKVG